MFLLIKVASSALKCEKCFAEKGPHISNSSDLKLLKFHAVMTTRYSVESSLMDPLANS